MRHDDFEGELLYCVEKFVRIERNGPAEHYFGTQQPVLQEENKQFVEELPPDVVPFLGLHRDNIDPTDQQHLAAVIPTDDDNEPAPENIHQAEQQLPPEGQ